MTDNVEFVTAGSGAGPDARSGMSRGKVAAAVVGSMAVVGLAVGGAAAVNVLGGGGAQPEDIVPANAVMFAKIDLNPASGQKIDALRFLRKFPALKDRIGMDDTADLRRKIFEEAQKEGAFKDLSYDADIAPWLGDRFAFAAVPTDGGKDVAAVAILASTDEAKAKAAIAKAGTTGSTCDVVADFVRCAEKPEHLAAFAAGDAPLAKAANFSGDMKDLGEDGIASMWVDVKGAFDLAAAAGATGTDSLPAEQMAKVKEQIGDGRMVAALRFDGPNLELAGSVKGTKVTGNPGKDAGAIAALPADTIAAASISGLGEQLTKTWADLEKSFTDLTSSTGGSDPIAEAEQQLGIQLPEDIVKIVGNKTTIAFGGMDTGSGMPKVALKTDGDPAVVQKLMSKVAEQGQAFGFSSAKGVTLAMDQAYADAVATGSGLDQNATFTAAMPDYAKATQAGFVDIAKVVEQFGADIPADEKANLAPLSAFGFSASQDGGDADFTLRLTTK